MSLEKILRVLKVKPAGSEVEIEFEVFSPSRKSIFRGVLRLEKGEPELKFGRYLYSSRISHLWNDFNALYFADMSEFTAFLRRVSSGEHLLDTMIERSTPPEGTPPSFRDGYGYCVMEDIKKAIMELFLNREENKEEDPLDNFFREDLEKLKS